MNSLNDKENDIFIAENNIIISTSKRGQNRTNYKYTNGWANHYKET
jgi:hypothetical protein